jgi:beta-glucanase (GH16 family)
MHIRPILVFILLFYSGLGFSQAIEPSNYKKYSGACLSSTKFFNPGIFQFDVKASKVSGTIFCAFLTDFEVNRSQDHLKHAELGFELVGEKIDSILCVAILYGGRNFIKRFPLGFNASEKFHQYTIVQENTAVRWLVDGVTIYQLDTEPSQVLMKPMRLYINFRPAVSHCDVHWGCIRQATLPTDAYVKNFKYMSNVSTRANTNITYPIFEKDFKDNFNGHQDKLWQFSFIDLIKGNKPIYLLGNLKYSRKGLKMTINRDDE